MGPALYAPIARAIHDGVKAGNPDALVAAGQTSPRGRDLPSTGPVQDSHSPARFARLLSEQTPRIPFDAWAQHPYPPRSAVAPSAPVRWPRVGLGNLERFGESLDTWFEREDTPIWITEYGHETEPGDPLGIPAEQQADYAEEALALAAESSRVRVFVWFILRDRSETPWQSGVLAEDGTAKPAFARFTQAAEDLDARNPVLPDDAELVRVPALELAYSTPAGDPILVSVEGAGTTEVPLGVDGWLEVPLEADMRPGDVIELRATNAAGQAVDRLVELDSDTVELN